MDQINIGKLSHPVMGEIWFAVNPQGLFALDFPTTRERFLSEHRITETDSQHNDLVLLVQRQLKEYLEGERRSFDLPLDWEQFPEFQKKALRATFEIPYGQTKSYKQVAILAGSPNGARAVGRAEAANPIPIVIPCHRVLGSDQNLRGYGAGNGLATKQWLLDLESKS